MINISPNTAIILMLITTFGWGSWFQCIKRLRGFPVSAFMLLLYSFALVIVWGAIGLFAVFQPAYIGGNILQMVGNSPGLAVLVVVCGAIFAMGMQIQMHVVSHIGLILSTSIFATINMIMNVTISTTVGGVGEGTSLPLIVVAAAILVGATIVCQVAGRLRDKDNGRVQEKNYVTNKKAETKSMVMLVICAVVFSPAYTLGMSKGVATDLNPEGFPSLVCVGLLCLGSFLGSILFSGVYLTRTKQWGCFKEKKYKSCYFMAFISGFCHYGGNVVHTVAIPVLSMAIAGPMSTVSNMWSYFWGILYGEFKGSKKKTVIILSSGLLLYVIGILLFCMNLYW